MLALGGLLTVLLPGVAMAGAGDSIVQRFWDAGFGMLTSRLHSQVPAVTQFLDLGEQTFLGQDDDFTTLPAVQDVFNGMRVAGLLLLAFCTVISLVELTEANISGNGYGLVAWFKRFFTATILTFGGLQFYAIWIRLFNVLLVTFRGYLDTHWTGGQASGLYGMVVQLLAAAGAPFLLVPFILLTLLTLLILWFLIGGVRKAEMMIGVMMAPLVWPVYLIPSLEDIPKTAFRGFIGLCATLLIVVGMLRLAVRLALGPGLIVNIWQLVPAIGLLVMTIFLPTIVKRVVGQGHSGVGALMTAVNLAAGLKFLSMGMGARIPSATPPAGPSTPTSPPTGGSSYPIASAGPSAAAGSPGSSAPSVPEPPTVYGRARIRNTLPAGSAASGAPSALGDGSPGDPHTIDMDVQQVNGRYVASAVESFVRGYQSVHDIYDKDPEPDPGGEL